MKYFLDSSAQRVRVIALAVFFAAIGGTVSALGELPSWIRNIDASSAVEAVFQDHPDWTELCFRPVGPQPAGGAA